jgi:uncharacterized protein DUF4231
MDSPLRRGDPRLSGYLLNPNHTLSLVRFPYLSAIYPDNDLENECILSIGGKTLPSTSLLSEPILIISMKGLLSRIKKRLGFTKDDKKEDDKKKDEYRSKPKFPMPRENEPPYVTERLGPFIRFFDNERVRNRKNEQRLQYLIIGFGAAIPVVNVFGISSPLSNILSSVFGGVVVVSTSFLQFEKYHERWLISKTTATKLTNEYYYWKNKVGDYAPTPKQGEGNKPVEAKPVEAKPVQVTGENDKELEDNGLALLVRNCEATLISEASEFVGLFNTRDRAGRPNPRDGNGD